MDDSIKEQATKFWAVKDALKDVPNAYMKGVLVKNKQPESGGDETLRGRVAEGLLYGALKVCPECA